MTEIKRVPEYDNKKRHCQPPLNIIFRRSSLSVIARLDRAIHHFMSCLSDAPVEPEHDRNKKAIIAEKSRSMR